MERYILIVFLFISSHSFSQSILVVDANTREALSYVLVEFPQNNQGLYTDDKGRVMLTFNSSKDSVKVHMLGYSSYNTIAENLKDTIFLKPVVYTLHEAVITTNKPVEQIVGFLKENRKKDRLVGYGEFPQVRIAVHVANDTKTMCKVEKLLYRYKVEDPNLQYVVRPQIYAVDNTNRPSGSLLSKSQIVTLTGEGILAIDCSNEQLTFPDRGIFVAIEILDVLDKQGNKVITKNGKLPFIHTIAYKNVYSTYVSSLHNLIWSPQPIFCVPELKICANAAFGISLKCNK